MYCSLQIYRFTFISLFVFEKSRRAKRDDFIFSEVMPMQNCSLDDVISSVKKSTICLKGILQTPTAGGTKSELESLNMAMR